MSSTSSYVPPAASLRQPHYQSTAALAALPAAGARPTPAGGADGAAAALRWEERPPTPESLGPHKHWLRQEPGSITRHPARARDAAAAALLQKRADGGAGAEPVTFGVRSCKGESAAAALAPDAAATALDRWRQEQAEAVYASRRLEPLGRAAPGPCSPPPRGIGVDVPAGRPLHVREQERLNATRDVLFPPAAAAAAGDSNSVRSARVAALRGHSCAPGERVCRSYDWASAGIDDPATHVFGRVEPTPAGGAREAMRQVPHHGDHQHQQQQQQQDAAAQAVWAAHKAFDCGAQLGKPRLLRAAARTLPESHAFGKPSAARELEPSVGELIRGGGGVAGGGGGNNDDPGLGRSSHHRNAPPTTTAHAASRGAAGAAPRGAAATTAAEVLSPPRCACVGLDEADLKAPRPARELAALLAAAGVALAEREFAEALALAGGGGGDGGACSVHDFMRARRQLLQRREVQQQQEEDGAAAAAAAWRCR